MIASRNLSTGVLSVLEVDEWKTQKIIKIVSKVNTNWSNFGENSEICDSNRIGYSLRFWLFGCLSWFWRRQLFYEFILRLSGVLRNSGWLWLIRCIKMLIDKITDDSTDAGGDQNWRNNNPTLHFRSDWKSFLLISCAKKGSFLALVGEFVSFMIFPSFFQSRNDWKMWRTFKTRFSFFVFFFSIKICNLIPICTYYQKTKTN